MAQRPCRDCGRDILLGYTVNGRYQPIDPEPNPGGNLAVYLDHLRRLRVRVLAAGAEPESYERRAMPHAATCPRRAPELRRELAPGVLSLAAARDRRRRRRT